MRIVLGSGRRATAMLQSMSPEVRECLAKAAEARRKGEATSDQEFKDFWRQMEDRWIGLARGYEHVHRTDSFLGSVAAAGRRGQVIEPTAPAPAPPAPAAGGEAFLRHEGAEFLQAAQDCDEPDIARELRAIAANLLNEANRESMPDRPANGSKPDGA